MSPQTPVATPDTLRAIATLQRLSDLFVERREQVARAAGLTVAQWQVLEEIGGEHFMPSLFARQRATSAPAVSRIIRQLLDRGLVRVAVNADDGRQRDYALTAEGRRALERVQAERERAIRAVWGGLRPEELEEFSRFGARLVERLEHYASHSRIRSGRQTNGKKSVRESL
ncbi:MAG: MarR family transcriptional regulator [Candidatus Sumerlaeaceae bacterium]|nr:MarR family transcriptional regulator [Candidatus Sumerlaeaceae bacterium]